jgi:hypothetical protein
MRRVVFTDLGRLLADAVVRDLTDRLHGRSSGWRTMQHPSSAWRTDERAGRRCF